MDLKSCVGHISSCWFFYVVLITGIDIYNAKISSPIKVVPSARAQLLMFSIYRVANAFNPFDYTDMGTMRVLSTRSPFGLPFDLRRLRFGLRS